MAFEAFTSGRRITKEPAVSIMKQGGFNFNSGSTKLFKENAVTHLQLMFDKETNRIAFKPCTQETPGAYALRHVKSMGQVSGNAFLNHHKIPYSEATRSFPATWQDDLLIISLN